MTAAEELAEHLASDFELPDGDDERHGFRIADDRMANWALRRLGALQRREDEVRTAAREQRDLIDAWEHDQLAALGRDTRFFEGALGDYLRRQLDDELAPLLEQGLSFEDAWAKLKAKSRKLAAGTLSASKGRESVIIDDEERLIEWARTNAPEAITTKYVPSKNALTQYNRRGGLFVTDDGHLVPGVHIETPGVTYKAVPAVAD